MIIRLEEFVVFHHKKCDFNKFYNSAFESQKAMIPDGIKILTLETKTKK